jgi:hypothetical protein
MKEQSGEKVCPICHKVFIPAPLHMYKIGRKDRQKMVCSYKCRCEAERRKNDTKRVFDTRV